MHHTCMKLVHSRVKDKNYMLCIECLMTFFFFIKKKVTVVYNRVSFFSCFYLLFHRFPVIAYGVLRWVDYTVSDASYFKLNTDHTPLHLVLIDEVSRMYRSTNIYSIDRPRKPSEIIEMMRMP